MIIRTHGKTHRIRIDKEVKEWIHKLKYLSEGEDTVDTINERICKTGRL